MAGDNKLKEFDIKNCMNYYFTDMLNINDFNRKNTKVDKK